MGDRCTCYIYTKLGDKDKTRELLQGIGWKPDVYVGKDEEFAQFEMSDVNYADLSDETALLLEHGIEHSIWNGEGGNYDEGHEHYRFTEKGELYKAEYTEKQKFIDPQALKQWLDFKDIDLVKQKLADHIAYTTEPAYDMTGLNAKRYLMNQMVKP